jgi:pimeloyl-ACP methyl ester carboxylesterase
MATNDYLISSRYVRAGNLNIHYLTAGEGEPVVLLHGWPTHSYLWRKIIKPLANIRRVIVPDLPGFGKSDKPLDVSYGFDFQSGALDEILNSLNIKKTALVVHDIAGPIGLHWAIRNKEKLERLAILDTFLHPDAAPMMRILFFMFRFRMVSNWGASPSGIAATLRWGVANKNVLSKEDIAAYQAPFASPESRAALVKTLNNIKIDDLGDIVKKFPELGIPISIIYGEKDIWLASEMRRIGQEIPDSNITSIPNCGHFLQEDQPERLSELLVEFLSK